MSGRRSEQIRRQAGRNYRRRRGERNLRQAELRGRLADQHGDGVFEEGALHTDVSGLRASGVEYGLRLGDVHGGSEAAVITTLS